MVNESKQVQVSQEIEANTGTVIGVQYRGLSPAEVAELFVTMKQEGQPTVWNGRIPYLGLTAFQENDAEFFFGRESLVEELLARVEQSNFIVIAGPSGSGKSSVARAGLFHALRNGRLPRSDIWLLEAMQPKNDPIEQLAQVVTRLAKSPVAGDYIRENATHDPHALHQQVAALLTDDVRQRALLLVDQFEEIFTQTKDEAVQAAFISLLTTAAQATNGRLTIILSLRSDFVSQCAHYPQLRQLVSQQFQLVGGMSPPELAKAITLPALAVGAEIDPALVSRILADMKGEPGALPLMSFALRDLFEAEKSQKGKPMDMTLPEYQKRGGIEDALERHANKVFANFTDEQKQLAENIFSKLIEIGQGRVDTRRTASFAELIPVGASQTAVTDIVSQLAQEGVRLIITSSGVISDDPTTTEASQATTVTIAHEKLIDAWPWLRLLVDKKRDLIALQNQISNDAQVWLQEGEGFLYRKGQLLQVKEKLQALQPNLNDLSNRFIQASLDEHQREIDEREAQRQRELEYQRELAEKERQQAYEQAQSASSLRRRLIYVIGALVVAVILGTVAVMFGNRATQNAIIAQNNLVTATAALIAAATAEADAIQQEANALTRESEALIAGTAEANARATAEANENKAFARQLAADADTQLNNQLDLAILLSVEANRRYDEVKTKGSLLNGLIHNPNLVRYLREHSAPVESVDTSPDGQLIATIDSDGKIILWDTQTVAPLTTFFTGHQGSGSVVFSPNSRILAVGSGTEIRLWDTESYESIGNPLVGHRQGAIVLAFGSNVNELISGSLDGTVRIWDIEKSTQIRELNHSHPVHGIGISPDGSLLAVGLKWGNRTTIWNIQTPEPEFVIDLFGHDNLDGDTITRVEFSPNGKILATAGKDDRILLWDVDSIRQKERKTIGEPLIGHANWVFDIDFSSDSELLVSVGWDSKVIIWDVNTQQMIGLPLDGHKENVTGVSFIPNSHIFLSTSFDSNAILWDADARRSYFGHENVVGNLTFSPNGQLLASVDYDGKVIVWDVNSTNGFGSSQLAKRFELREHAIRVFEVTFSPDSKTLASSGQDGDVILWNMETGEKIITLEGQDGNWVFSTKFSPNADTLFTSKSDGTIVVWDLSTFTQIDSIATMAPYDIVINPSGKILAVASQAAGQIIIMDIESHESLHTMGDLGPLRQLVFSPDGKVLASVSDDRTIRLWDVDSGQPIGFPLIGHSGWVLSVEFSTDGKTLISSSQDNTIRLWDVATQQQLGQPIEGHNAHVWSVDLSSDGRILASSSSDLSLILWDIGGLLSASSDALIEVACKKIQRNYTYEEWQFWIDEPYRQTCEL